MRFFAKQLNELGQALHSRDRFAFADCLYSAAIRFDPSWASPWFNRGLIAKFHHRWQECFDLTLRATQVDPAFMPAWWNLGIAATALGNWAMARRAWSGYGVNVPQGEGPLRMNLGRVPIRIDPKGNAEVIWRDRIDPARAVIRNVPLPDSGRAYGDVLLHDGEPKGYRTLGNHQVSVFNELEILEPSAFRTYLAELTVPTPQAAADLEDRTVQDTLGIDDWSSLRILCVKCSEGTPHEHEPAGRAWQPNRRFGVAALTESVAITALRQWASAGEGRRITAFECVLARE